MGKDKYQKFEAPDSMEDVGDGGFIDSGSFDNDTPGPSAYSSSAAMPEIDDRKDKDTRNIYINNSLLNEKSKFSNNAVHTAKYSLLSFVPKFLFEQFRRYANLFFLFIIVLQQFPAISPTGRWTTLLPLLFVLGVTCIKEVLEDWKRHQSDSEVNERLVRVLRNGTFQTVLWQQVKVGDIVRVVNDQMFPADLVLLSSSEPQGVCYVETANLDGETNLKIRQACRETSHTVSPGDVRFLTGSIQCEGPNNRLYSFKGVMNVKNDDRNHSVTLQNEQVLLRGSQLRNTQWIYGVVVYTGHEAKLLQNATAAPIKRTQMDKITNNQILFLFGGLVGLALVSAIGSEIWLKNNRNNHVYLFFNENPPSNFGIQFLTFVVLYNNLIPISLIVTLEFVKYVQALMLINNDLEMYDEKSDTPATVRTSNLNEELGQVEYIFSDKTGTLTQNIMEFRKCTIAGITYGAVGGEVAPPGTPEHLKNEEGQLLNSSVGFTDPRLLDNLTSGHPTAPVIRQFLTLLAVCHTVIPEVSKDDPDKIIYQAQSPDEGALVGAVKKLGFSFNIRTPTTVTINVLGQDEVYEILTVCEFTSTRKRMSVIVRTPQGSLLLMTKGADNVIYDRLAPNQPFTDATTKHLEEYAATGLRTLCIAVAEIDPVFYESWAKEFDAACKSLGDREADVGAVCEKIEKDLFLLGATAIEDKLQDDVPETISCMLDAGIKVWVLTGDKQETAINIGYSCKLFTEDMNLIVCNAPTKSECRDWLSENLAQLRTVANKRNAGLAFVVDGASLTYAMEDDLKKDFLEIALLCKSVCCCRVSPLQKSQVVKLVRDKCKAVTLAIGDGANDVPMIQSAHVGVGISGQEGLQAARSADYAIAQFKFLRRLLLVHGYWSYRRLSNLVLYSFYKNIVLYIIQFWFAVLNGFSGQILFDEWMLATYNVAFTALPPLMMGIFDRPLKAVTLMKVPQLYRSGIKSQFFNTRVFWQWSFNGIFQSALIFYLVFIAYDNPAVLHNGQTVGLWSVGVATYSAVLITVTLKAMLIFDSWTIWTHVSIWVSLLLYLVFLLVYCALFPAFGYTVAAGVYGVQYKLLGSGTFWFSMIIIPCIAIGRDYIWKAFQRIVIPLDYHIIQEMENMDRDPTLMKIAGSFTRILEKIPVLRPYVSHGFAFSQEERGNHNIGQADIIRAYDTNLEKPEG